jgi:hypothetical protein
MSPDIEAGSVSMLFLIMLIALALVLTAMMWLLIHSSPFALSMILPRKLVLTIGTCLLIVAIFSAFCASYVLKDPGSMLACFVQGFVGLWLILSTSSSARGSELDRRMMKSIFAMLGVLGAVLIASLYVSSHQFMAMLNLMLVGAGFWLTTNYLRHLDRGR